MSRFDADVRTQGDVLRSVFRAYADPKADVLEAARLVAKTSSRVILTGMGSSLSAACAGASGLMQAGWPSAIYETGELLHYGVDSLPADTAVILVSQSGETIEGVRLLQRLRQSRAAHIVAIVNETQSTIAGLADVVLPMHAGTEAHAATKTFFGSFAAVLALVDVLTGARERFVDLALAADLPGKIDTLSASEGPGEEAAKRFGSCGALAVLGRGPTSSVVHYSAQMLRELTTFPVEAMPGASFRHGPIEVAGPSLGVVVLAAKGRTDHLMSRLAQDTAELASPTWLLTTVPGETIDRSGRLFVMRLPEVPEPVAPLLFCPPLQHLAKYMALSRGREPGVLVRVGKVTLSEG